MKDTQYALFREIEILENMTVADLGYCVLSSVDANGSHLFNIMYKSERFEFIYDTMDMPRWNFYYNPAKYKLLELDITVGDFFNMEYNSR